MSAVIPPTITATQGQALQELQAALTRANQVGLLDAMATSLSHPDLAQAFAEQAQAFAETHAVQAGPAQRGIDGEMVKNIPTRLRVFGSRATGANRPNSDIDVLVEGSDEEIERVKAALRYYSIEQGGPLDLFMIGSIDNPIDLVAAYSPKSDPRAVCVGVDSDLEDMFSSSYDVSLDTLLKDCVAIDKVWGEGASTDRERDKAESERDSGPSDPNF